MHDFLDSSSGCGVLIVIKQCIRFSILDCDFSDLILDELNNLVCKLVFVADIEQFFVEVSTPLKKYIIDTFYS